jgi:prephenate dehydrogenase
MRPPSRSRRRSGTLGIVGLGLIGGAVALAARRRRAFERIVAADRDAGVLARARRRGVIDDAGTLAEVAAQADVLVLAAPPRALVSLVPNAMRALRPGCLATDVCSAKRAVAAAAPRPGPRGPWLVPAHPLAGNERSGLEGATPDLLDGALCPITPVPGTPRAVVARTAAFWRRLGLRPFVVGAAAHDRAVAATSHLPFVIASLLSLRLDARRRAFAGPALRDATRVAASDTRLWVDILLQNRDEVRRALQSICTDLEWVASLLEREDANGLARALARARRRRTSWASEWAAR